MCVGEREGRGEIGFSSKMVIGLVRNYCVTTLNRVTKLTVMALQSAMMF
jgi:hypothetical protein